MHLGALRTALFNYLFAKQKGGDFALRIEDTDRKRLVPGSVDQILRTLEWTNIQKDDFAVQSERNELYHTHVNELIAKGHAYKCYCTEERLTQMREAPGHGNAKYDRHCLTHLTDQDKEKLELEKTPYVIRMKVFDSPESKKSKLKTSAKTRIEDGVFGTIDVSHDEIDDQVLMKSDGTPTYHLANVVDDHDMGITHVIRGAEWIPSTAKHIMLYDMFGWKPPKFSHLPLLCMADGQKLSKRHGHASVDWYKEKGFLPMAVVNFVALLGWNPGNDQEVFLKMEDLISCFSIDRVGRGNSVVDIKRLEWINAQHIRALVDTNIEKAIELVMPDLKTILSAEQLADIEYIKKVLVTARDRMKHMSDLAHNFDYFFLDVNFESNRAQEFYKSKIVSIKERKQMMTELRESLETVEWNQEAIGVAVNRVRDDNKRAYQQLIQLLRYYLTGSNVGAAINNTLETLGREVSMKRFADAMTRIETIETK
jgi:glutamyl-tRNA synthetase